MQERIRQLVEDIFDHLDDSFLGNRQLRELKISELSIHLKIAIDRRNSREARFALEDKLRLAIAEASDRAVLITSVDVEDNHALLEGAVHCEERQAPKPQAPKNKTEHKHIPGVKHCILVCSAKGGVGKSTVSLNLALALAKDKSKRVSLLDLDLYGPSLPSLLGGDYQPILIGDQIVPPEAYGLCVMSLGFMLEPDKALMWRGPMVNGVINQLLWEVDWSGTDYLIIDMPPGTGDSYLSLLQTVHIDGAIIVTTPSELALADVRRGIQVFEPFDVPVLGVIENMASYDWEGRETVLALLDGLELPDENAQKRLDRAKRIIGTSQNIRIFGNRTDALIRRLKLKKLAAIPLDIALQNDNDAGTPYMNQPKKESIKNAFMQAAAAVEAALAENARRAQLKSESPESCPVLSNSDEQP